MSAVVQGIMEVDSVPRVGRKMFTGYMSFKPLIDVVLAALMLLCSAPCILVAMLLARLTSKGPAIYAQNRLGRGGRPIRIYKIRTMYHDSERETGPVWSRPGDPRVTPLGRFLRWAHLDELPQLVNILRGEMSLVGPRPERPELAASIERALPAYPRRLSVRPGLTGLAQVLQSPDSDLSSVRRKLDLDLYYIERMSLWLDLRVLLGTVLKCSSVPFDTIRRVLRFPGNDVHDEREPFASCEDSPPPLLASHRPVWIGEVSSSQ
jgi:lipopolysaccharide/colanic/teichoic acid biosynthesis glycosyltransferase